MQFLVNIMLRVPDDRDNAEVRDLRRAEADRAAKLVAEGALLRLWRVPDRWANWGLWEAPSREALGAVLDSLPLRPYMTVEIHGLAPHPNDPTESGSARRYEEEPQW